MPGIGNARYNTASDVLAHEQLSARGRWREVASPADRPITCITLETIIAFAARLKAHVGHCPASSYAQSASEWDKTRVDYAARFTQNRCKRTF